MPVMLYASERWIESRGPRARPEKLRTCFFADAPGSRVFYLGQTGIRLNALIKLLTWFGLPVGRLTTADIRRLRQSPPSVSLFVYLVLAIGLASPIFSVSLSFWRFHQSLEAKCVYFLRLKDKN